MSMRTHSHIIFALFSISMEASLMAAEMYKTMNISLPIISFGRESVAKAEFNLRGHGALGVELNLARQSEIYSDKEVEEKNGDSLLMKGSQLALLYSQYSNSKMLSGGFWSFGAGYRQVQADWTETPSKSADLQGISLNSEGKMRHVLVGSGITAHARAGYRYVAASVPLSIGAYLGVRHYQSKMRDTDADGSSLTRSEDLSALQRRLASRLEPGIELGLAF